MLKREVSSGDVACGLIGRSPGRGWRVVVFSVAAGLSSVWALGLAGSAAALPSNCSQAGATVTCTYMGAGAYTFMVPVGVSSLDVTAVGAAGGRGGTLPSGGGLGGPGASVEDTKVPVSGRHHKGARRRLEHRRAINRVSGLSGWRCRR